MSFQEMWTYEGHCFPRNFVFHTLCYLSVVSLTVLDHLIGIRLGSAPNYHVLVLRVLPSRVAWRTIRTCFLKKKTRCVVTYRTHARLLFKSIFLFGKHTVVFVAEFPYVRLGLPNGNHSGSLLANRFRRPTWENGIHMGDDSSGEQCMANIPTLVQGAGYKDYTSKQKLLEEATFSTMISGAA